MKCPYCTIELPRNHHDLFICPHCSSILNKKLRDESLPACDYSGNPVIECRPNLTLVQERGRLADYKRKYDLKKLRKDHKKNMRVYITGAILFSGLVYMGHILPLGEELAFAQQICTGILCGFILAIIRECLLANQEKQRLTLFIDEVVPQVIRMYHNEYIFGVVSVPKNCNATNEYPFLNRTEIPKSCITDITHMHTNTEYYQIQYKNNKGYNLELSVPYVIERRRLTEILPQQ